MSEENIKRANEHTKKKKFLREMIKMKTKDLKICVLGAGHGGLSMAGHLAIKGYNVNLFNRSIERIEPIIQRKKIKVEGAINGVGELKIVSDNIEECIKDSNILLVVVPATAHSWFAEQCAPYISEDQIIILNPGRTGGTLEFYNVLKENGVKDFPFIGEAQTFLYASRALGPAHAKIFSIKNSVPLATLPAYWIPGVLKVINKILPQFIPGDNIFKTGFNNIGAIFHPGITVLNASWIEEKQGDFDYYLQGVGPSVARVLETLDRERIKIAGSLGIEATSAKNWLYNAYSASGRNLYEAIHSNPGYTGIKAPQRLHHRYIEEDVPMSLVPMVSIGKMLGVETPTMESIIHIASIMRDFDFWKIGRTADKLGLRGMSIKDIRFLAVSGTL